MINPAVIFLALGGAAAWWASRQQAKAAGATTDPVADLLTGRGGGGSAGQRSPVTIEKIGADTIIPSSAEEFEQLRAFAGQLQSSGGYGRIETPDYIWEIETPPATDGGGGTTTTTPQPPVPVHTSTVYDIAGFNVPLDSFYIGSIGSVWFQPPGMDRIMGFYDVYMSLRPGYKSQQVFRPAGYQAPALHFDLAGRLVEHPFFEILLYNGKPYSIPNLLYKPENDDSEQTGKKQLLSAMYQVYSKIWQAGPAGGENFLIQSWT